ncbi:lipocalin (plasmid) [Cereibacter azotoformans]|uniref:Uncharacterized protein n=1 Tax=Cereibacter azotoformans TaxID=43057 RepID=A0A2T5JUL6_9RHOB|nr:lipocalin [Cereibacter azotoformans]PTR13873.1 hypothetical protein C8J28_11938 [Cereibacter azotoformans]UIJ33154.1 lipocalin [Cereibacter azotoformans]
MVRGKCRAAPWGWLGAWILVLMLGVAEARAQSYELGRSGDLVVSERLRILAHGRALADGASPMARIRSLKADMTAQGFYHEGPGLAWVLAEASLRPTLGWSPNLNGGVSRRRIEFGGGWLEIDPAYVARAGATAGLRFESEARLAWGTGRFLQAELDGAISRARESGYERRDRRFLLCSGNHVTGWTFLDLCLRQTESDRSLSQSEQRDGSVAVSRLFAAPGSYHEIRMELGERRRPGMGQPRVGLEWHSVWSGAATRFGLDLGRPVRDQTVERLEAFAELRWRMGGAVTGLSLWGSHASGGQVFGIGQRDRTLGLALFRQITPRLDLSVQYVQTDSTVDLFDSRQVGLDLSWRLRLR